MVLLMGGLKFERYRESTALRLLVPCNKERWRVNLVVV